MYRGAWRKHLELVCTGVACRWSKTKRHAMSCTILLCLLVLCIEDVFFCFLQAKMITNVRNFLWARTVSADEALKPCVPFLDKANVHLSDLSGCLPSYRNVLCPKALSRWACDNLAKFWQEKETRHVREGRKLTLESTKKNIKKKIEDREEE